MVPRKVTATLLLLYMVAMLAKQSEGFISFYGHGDFERMQERERNQGQKESLVLQKRSDTRGFAKLSEDEQQVIKLIAPVEIGIHLNSRQLEKYQDVLEELLAEILPDTQNDMPRKTKKGKTTWARIARQNKLCSSTFTWKSDTDELQAELQAEEISVKNLHQMMEAGESRDSTHNARRNCETDKSSVDQQAGKKEPAWLATLLFSML